MDLRTLERWLYPPTCALCGGPATDKDLCSGCAMDLPANHPACMHCAVPLPTEHTVCGPCLRRPPPFRTVVVPWLYAPPMDHLLKRLKFQGCLAHARVLGELLAERLLSCGVTLPEALVTVPLHRGRLAERGFNQTTEIARPVARSLGVPLETGLAYRRHATPAQSNLRGPQRRRQLAGAFGVVTGRPGYRHVAVVDDIVTTSHTVAELTRTLQRAGIPHIDVWAIARAAPPGPG